MKLVLSAQAVAAATQQALPHIFAILSLSLTLCLSSFTHKTTEIKGENDRVSIRG